MQPQTVAFQAEITLHDGRVLELVFHEHAKLMERWWKQRKRRRVADRAIRGRYMPYLTEHGKQVCAADPDRAKSHADMCDKWFDL